MTTTLTDPRTDELQQYLRDVEQFDTANREKNLDLAKRCAAGDEEAISQMVNANLRLVINVVFKYYRDCNVPMLDLCQEGNLALMEAVKKFDYTKGNSFSTYARECIKNHIATYLSTHATVIPVSEYAGNQIRRLKREQTRLQQETGHSPTLQELAQAVEMTQEKVQELLLLTLEIYSLDKPTKKEDGNAETTLGQTEEDHSGTGPEQTLAQKELRRILTELLSRLDSRKQTILRLHFGLEDGICHSLEDIAKGLHLSKERVRQLKNQAMDKLQSLGASFGLEDFLDDLD